MNRIAAFVTDHIRLAWGLALALILAASLLVGASVRLLLSEERLEGQGVVFAVNRSEWVGSLAGKATPERLTAIRQLKQFGAMFENRDPPPLPFDPTDGLISIEGKDYALASAKVLWND